MDHLVMSPPVNANSEHANCLNENSLSANKYWHISMPFSFNERSFSSCSKQVQIDKFQYRPQLLLNQTTYFTMQPVWLKTFGFPNKICLKVLFDHLIW